MAEVMKSSPGPRMPMAKPGKTAKCQTAVLHDMPFYLGPKIYRDMGPQRYLHFDGYKSDFLKWLEQHEESERVKLEEERELRALRKDLHLMQQAEVRLPAMQCKNIRAARRAELGEFTRAIIKVRQEQLNFLLRQERNGNERELRMRHKKTFLTDRL